MKFELEDFLSKLYTKVLVQEAKINVLTKMITSSAMMEDKNKGDALISFYQQEIEKQIEFEIANSPLGPEYAELLSEQALQQIKDQLKQQ